MVVAHVFIPVLRRQRLVDVCEFKVSQVYRVRSRIAGLFHRETLSRKNKTKQTKKWASQASLTYWVNSILVWVVLCWWGVWETGILGEHALSVVSPQRWNLTIYPALDEPCTLRKTFYFWTPTLYLVLSHATPQRHPNSVQSQISWRWEQKRHRTKTEPESCMFPNSVLLYTKLEIPTHRDPLEAGSQLRDFKGGCSVFWDGRARISGSWVTRQGKEKGWELRKRVNGT